MKKTKIFLTGVVALLISLLTPIHPSYGAEANSPSAWAKADVEYMVKEGLVPESLQGDYKKKITRAEFTSLVEPVLHRITQAEEELHKVLTEHRFADALDSYIYEAYQFGIVNGISEHEFMPNRSIERKEAAVMIGNILKTLQVKGLSYEQAPYVDYKAIPVWAREAANITYHAQIFQGSKAGMEPDKPYTREQSIVTMKRLLDMAGEVEGISYRGKIYVKFDQIDDVRVGSNYIKLGSPKAEAHFDRFWSSVSSQFPGVKLTGRTPQPVVSGEYTIETLGKDYLIKISW